MRSFIIGLLAVLFLFVSNEAVAIMYPEGADTFINFLSGLVLISAVIGILTRLLFSKNWLTTTVSGGLIFLAICTIFLGLYYSYQLKTDEFLFFFLSSLISFLLFTYVFANHLTFLFIKAPIEINLKLIELSIIILGGVAGIGILLLSRVVKIDIIPIWLLIVAFTSLLLYSQKRSSFDSQRYS